MSSDTEIDFIEKLVKQNHFSHFRTVKTNLFIAVHHIPKFGRSRYHVSFPLHISLLVSFLYRFLLLLRS